MVDVTKGDVQCQARRSRLGAEWRCVEPARHLVTMRCVADPPCPAGTQTLCGPCAAMARAGESYCLEHGARIVVTATTPRIVPDQR